jgi:antitoxin MazE
MVKKLTRHGNSLALVIDKPILDLLDMNEQTPLEIVTDGRSLIVSPADPKRRKKFDEAVQDTFQKYGRMLKRLAE